MKKIKGKKKRGAERMKENGMRLVSVWLDRAEADVVEQAAKIVSRPLATFVRQAATASAAVILQARANHQSPNQQFWENMTSQDASG